jgi:hypothetical protein
MSHLKKIQGTTATAIWMEDLAAFEASWQKLLASRLGQTGDKKGIVIVTGRKQPMKKSVGKA